MLGIIPQSGNLNSGKVTRRISGGLRRRNRLIRDLTGLAPDLLRLGRPEPIALPLGSSDTFLVVLVTRA
jgi:hypothetical protein